VLLTRAGRVAAALVACALALPAAQVRAGVRDGACPEHVFRAWLVHRTVPGPRPLSLAATFRDSRSDHAMLIAAGVRPYGRRWLVTGDAESGTVVVGGTATPWPMVYGNGHLLTPVHSPGPPVAALCNDPSRQWPSSPIELSFNPRTPIDHDVYVGVYDVDVSLTASSGWAVEYVPGGSMTVVGKGDSGTGVEVEGLGVERFDGTAPVTGGPWGSVAWAALPCESYVAGPGIGLAPGGVGSATLYGGEPERGSWPERRTMSCATGHTSTLGGATHGTAWRLLGEAAGVNAAGVRLGVFNFPPPPRR
jgi:hypothetical protein